MATTIGELVVKLSADAAKFLDDIDKSTKDLQKLGDVAKGIAVKAGIAFAGFTGAIGLSVKAASESRRSQEQLAQAFRVAGQSLDPERFQRFANALQSVTLIGDETTKQMGTMLVRFGATQGQIESLIPRIADFAAATKQDAVGATETFARALAGNLGAVSRLIGPLDDQTRAIFESGTAADRAAIVFQALTHFQGTAAKEAQTATGRFGQFREALGDALEEVGAIFEQPLAQFFEAATKAVKELSPEAKRFAGAALGIGAALTGIVTAGATVLAILPSMAKGFLIAKGAANALSLSIGGIGKAAKTAGIIGLVASLGVAANRAAQLAGAVSTQRGAQDVAASIGLTAEDTGLARFGKALQGAASHVFGFSDHLAHLEDATEDSGPKIDSSADEVQRALAEFGGALGETSAKVRRTLDFEGFPEEVASEAAFAIQSALNREIGDAQIDELFPTEASQEAIAVLQRLSMEVESAADASDRLDDALSAASAGIREAPIVRALAAPVGAAALTAGAGAEQARAFGTAEGERIGQTIAEFAAPIDSALAAGGALVTSAIDFGTGAFASLLVGALQDTPEFEQALGLASAKVAQMAEALAPLITSLLPLIEVAGDLGIILVDLLGPVLRVLGKALEFFGKAIRGVALFLLKLAQGFGKAFNAIIRFFERILNKIPGVDISLARFKINLNGVNRSIEELQSSTEFASDAEQNKVPPIEDGTRSFEDMSDRISELNDSLTNVPAGFKIALSRFDAALGEGPEVGLAGGRAQAGQITINIQAIDAEDAWHRLNRVESFRSFASRATSIRSVGNFAVTRAGA